MNQARRIPVSSGTGETALLLAAERLFAERGIEAVSLRQINQAANQKNISAAHYHFGSRDGLVLAVLMHRWPKLDQRRGELLESNGAVKDVRFYLEAFINPLVDEMNPREEGNYYLRFMQQYERYRSDYEVARSLTPFAVEIYDRIERILYYLPAPVRQLRMGYLINMIHSVLATAEERLGKNEICHADIDLIATNMIDMFVSALTAPLSVDAIELLAEDRFVPVPPLVPSAPGSALDAPD